MEVQYLKGISACTEAALTPSGAGAGSPAGETPREQLKGFVYKGFGLISYLPGRVPGAAGRREHGGIAGRVPE